MDKKKIRVAAAIFHDQDKILATQRGYGKYKDWWEFPGGKIEPGETPGEALVREIKEELDIIADIEEYFMSVEYDYPEFHLSMDCFWCGVKEGEFTLLEHEAAKWLPMDDLKQVKWLPADMEILDAIGKLAEKRKELFDREKAKSTFLSYASQYDIKDPKIRLKIDHTMRVAALCEQIAGSLSLSGEDRDLIWLCGLLHDIGRFEQVRIYNTFKDADSVDHAQLSADLLFRDGMIREYIRDDVHDRLIETAIRCHNVYRLPAALSEREQTFCRMLRDADKIDILRVNRETPMTEIYNLTEEEFLNSEISGPVYEDMMAHRDVNRANSRTGIDYLMGHIAFVYGLVYPVSFKLVKEQGYLDQMLGFESRNPKTRERMTRIREEVRNYLGEKISSEY